MIRRRVGKLVGTALVIVVMSGCSDGGPISREEARLRAEELQADLLAGGGGEALRALRELAARPPDGPLRDSAAALVDEVDGLFEEVVELRKELVEAARLLPEEEAAPGSISSWFRENPVRRAEFEVEEAERRRDSVWPGIREDLQGETIEVVDSGMRGGQQEKQQLERWLEAGRTKLAEWEAERSERE